VASLRISTLGDIDCRVTILSARQSRKREPWQAVLNFHTFGVLCSSFGGLAKHSRAAIMQPPLTHIRFAAAKTKAWPVTRSNYPYRLALRCPPSPIGDTSDSQAESWVVAVHAPMADKISRYTVESCDWLAGASEAH
jgi:hypothetical protein